MLVEQQPNHCPGGKSHCPGGKEEQTSSSSARRMSKVNFFLHQNKPRPEETEKWVPGENSLREFYMTQKKAKHIHFPFLPAVLMAWSAAVLLICICLQTGICRGLPPGVWRKKLLKVNASWKPGFREQVLACGNLQIYARIFWEIKKKSSF